VVCTIAGKTHSAHGEISVLDQLSDSVDFADCMGWISLDIKDA